MIPSTDHGLNAISVIIVVLLIVLGIFWLGVGVLQFTVGVNNSTSGMTGTGIWNVIWAVVELWFVRGVVRRYRQMVSTLTWIAAIGSIFGIVQILLVGAWLQILVVPLYIVLGVLAQANKDYFTELSPTKPWARRSAEMATMMKDRPPKDPRSLF